MASQTTPGVTAFAFSRLLAPETGAESVSLTADGHLMLSMRGDIMARTDALLLASENLQARPLHCRMQGRQVSDVFARLVVLEGEGHLILSRQAGTFHPVKLQRDLCFFAEPYVWAIESTLMWDVGVVPGSRSRRPIQLIRVAGEGRVALRAEGELIAIKISPERAYRVREDGFVGWVGNVIPQMVEDEAFVRCEGEGAVLLNLPSHAVPTPAVPPRGAEA